MTEKRYEDINKIIEYGVYAYIFFMFLAKGEGIRNILIFGNFGLWLFTLRHRNTGHLFREPVSMVFWIYLAVIPLSIFFSIDPQFSLIELKDEPLKSGMLFPVIATVFDNEDKFKRVAYVSLITAGVIVFAGYYSYLSHDMELLKPETLLVHAWHNKFARYLCMLLSFSFLLFFVLKKRWLIITVALFYLIAFLSIVLSTSRAGLMAFLTISMIWSFYLSKKKGYGMKRNVSVILSAFIIIGGLSYFFFSDVKVRINTLPRHVQTFHERTGIWAPALTAFAQRPLVGWGYGDRIFHLEEPYRNTSREDPPVKGPHNSFVKVLFHQGLAGFIPYTLLILGATVAFWKCSFRTGGIKSYMLISCASILLGNYMLHAMMASPKLIYLSVVLGMGMAAKNIHEDSYS